MKLKARRSKVQGTVRAPSSKSYTHRALIYSSLAPGESVIEDPLYSDDTCTTADICEMMGAEVDWDEVVKVRGTEKLVTPGDVIDCRGSGTSLRLLTAVAAHGPGISVLTGDGSLRKRPVEVLLKALNDIGVTCYSTRMNGLPPVVVFGGGIRGGEVNIRGDISSQYITALLIACPWAQEETVVSLSSKLESKPYVDITLEVLRDYGIEIHVSGSYDEFVIPPKQCFVPRNYKVPGDFSSAAFMLVQGALAGEVTVTNLDLGSNQGDKKIVDILQEMGAGVKVLEGHVKVEKDELTGIIIDVSNTPDLTPICAVLATQAKGRTEIINAQRLRLKESDRLSSITQELKKMGAHICEKEDSLVIDGPTQLKGTVIDPHQDHRIAMSCAVAASTAKGDTIIQKAECIDKSYPEFVNDIKSIGADVKCLSK
ncbi:MAG: 3-phosphoshikimate 1-carboxyvinyltransferase [Thermoplasmata archaeon]